MRDLQRLGLPRRAALAGRHRQVTDSLAGGYRYPSAFGSGGSRVSVDKLSKTKLALDPAGGRGHTVGEKRQNGEPMDPQTQGQILIRFGAERPGREDIATDVLRDAQTYFDGLNQSNRVEDVQTWRYLTEPGGQIVLSGRLQPLVNMVTDNTYQGWLTRLRYVFLDFTVALAQGGTNGAIADALDNDDAVREDMHRQYAGISSGSGNGGAGRS